MMRTLNKINFGCLTVALVIFLSGILIISGLVILGILQYFLFGG
jgi:hypothetical protein|nr:MAG TPA: hypothetical protein [Bacteriophage sp.]DAV50465.1 MAG TPA: hypothetical protein [Caudoviricetes sp.]DAW32393.1 MAG TPA: hypothetical protein [Caudoviricetes sp.]